jgi:CubicO group peptidase (beta-lactamase class C family)
MRSERESKPSSRRKFLRVIGVGTVGIAGCLGDDGSTEDDENGQADTETGTATPVAETPTDEPTDSTDDPSTPTDTPTRQETGDDEDDEAIQTELPLTGAQVPELSAFDEVVVSYMERFDIGAGALGVAHDGKIVLERGYGWADDADTSETAPNSFFRIGSVSKSLTKAAVYELVQAGALSYDDPVLPLLSVEPPNGEPADDRFGKITVRHLVDHQAGLVPAGNPEFQDPFFAPGAVADHLGIERPPTTEDFVRHLLDRELEYDPGTPPDELSFDPYSNAGYMVLTHLVEAVTGQSYQSYLESTVLPAPDEIGVAQADPEQRHPREVSYHSPRQYPTALDPTSDEQVPWADGGFLLEPVVGAGGHYASTQGLLAFMQEYWAFFGEPRTNEVRVESPAALGSLPGTLAVAYHYDDQTEIVALFNKRPQNPQQWTAVVQSLDQAAAGVESWPN